MVKKEKCSWIALILVSVLLTVIGSEIVTTFDEKLRFPVKIKENLGTTADVETAQTMLG